MKKPLLFLLFNLISTLTYCQFGPERIITTDLNGLNSIAVGDINGDLLPDGLGDFGPRQYVSIVQRGCRSVFAADIDGDGVFVKIWIMMEILMCFMVQLNHQLLKIVK